MSYTIMAGISAQGAVELVFQCNQCLENLVACHSGDGAAARVKLGESMHIGGIRADKAAAAAEYLAHVCDPARVIPSVAGSSS